MKYFRLLIMVCLLLGPIYILWQCSKPDAADTLELPVTTPLPGATQAPAK